MILSQPAHLVAQAGGRALGYLWVEAGALDGPNLRSAELDDQGWHAHAPPLQSSSLRTLILRDQYGLPSLGQLPVLEELTLEDGFRDDEHSAEDWAVLDGVGCFTTLTVGYFFVQTYASIPICMKERLDWLQVCIAI